MQGSNFERFAPLAGVLFVVLAIAAFATFGDDPPGSDEPTREIVSFWVDNDSQFFVSVVLQALASLALVFFGASLFRALRPADGGVPLLSVLPLVGTAITATGFFIDASVILTLADRADDLSPAAVEALSAFYENDFVPIAGGIAILALSAGLLIVRSGVLPKWLGWVAIVLFVVGVTPAGFIAFLAMGIWILVVSVMLFLQGGRQPQFT